MSKELPEGVEIAAVALNSAPDDVAAFARREQLPYPVYVGGGDVSHQLAITQFPTTYAVDAQGRIVARDAGWSPRWRLASMARDAASSTP